MVFTHGFKAYLLGSNGQKDLGMATSHLNFISSKPYSSHDGSLVCNTKPALFVLG